MSEEQEPKPQRTTKQIRANRENAKKSTGPKTTAGKKRSAKNAIQHGLTAESQITTVFEYEGEFNEFQDRVFRQFDPTSAIEMALVDRIVSLMWRLKRVPLMEAAALNHMCQEDRPHASLLYNSADPLTTIARYEGHLDRALHRALKELERIQKVRNATHFAFRTTNWHIAQEEMDYYEKHYSPRTFQSEPAETRTIPPQALGEAQSDPNAQRLTPNAFPNSQSSIVNGQSQAGDPTDPSDSSAQRPTPNAFPKPLLIQFVDDEEENNETNPLNLFSPQKEGEGRRL